MIRLIKKLIILAIIILAIAFMIYYITGNKTLLQKLGFNKDNIPVTEVKLDDTNFNKINIDLVATEFELVKGDEFKIESNNDKINYSVSSNTLNIKEKTNVSLNSRKLIIYLPDKMNIEDFDLESAAGTVNIEKLSVKDLDLELGAGKCVIDKIESTEESDIKGGAGEFVVKDGTLSNLSLKVSVGKVSVKSKISGNSSIDAGVGTLNIILKGTESDYEISAEPSVGNTKINGESINEYKVIGSGENRIKLDGGIGAISIDYE